MKTTVSFLLVLVLYILIVSSCSTPAKTETNVDTKPSPGEQPGSPKTKTTTRSKRLTAEIFDSTPDSELESVINDRIFAKMKSDMSDEYEIVTSLPDPQQAIYIVSEVEGEVDNGGFNQFFFNSSRKYANKMEKAFSQIGAEKFADLTRRANEAYNSNREQITKDQDGTIEGFSKSYKDNPLNKLDDEFFALDKTEDLEKLKINYIRRNKAAFIDN